MDNDDLMPHNFVVLKPGSLEEVGTLAETTGTQPDAGQRQFVPRSNKDAVFHAAVAAARVAAAQRSRPRRSRACIRMSARFPAIGGGCTGRCMWCADLDEYLAGPEAYLAAHPLPVLDELLKINRPRTDWKFEIWPRWSSRWTMAARSATASRCSRWPIASPAISLNGVGKQVGADLSKDRSVLQAAGRHPAAKILDPSLHINEKFYTYIFDHRRGQGRSPG